MELQNFLNNIPSNSATEVIQKMLDGRAFSLERIISYGQASPEGFWYDQDLDEWVIVLRGRAGLRFENSQEILEMRSGDFIYIPAHQKHRVEWTDETEPTVWLALHFERQPEST
jgi:cupin 2 domain-containing protein